MDWRTKAAIFRVLAVAPFADQLIYGLQRYVTREWPRPAEALDNLHRAALRIQQAAEGRTGHFVEVGAGGDLAVAIALRMLGVAHVTSVDISRLARLPLIRHAARHMARRIGAPLPKLDSWDQLQAFGITYRAPMDLLTLRLPERVADCFFSVDTLEHLPPEDLRATLAAGRRFLKTDGRSVHLVDYSDHYARGSAASRFNFLTFDEAAWRPFNTRLHYVNRLRHSQYLAILETTGHKIVGVEAEVASPQPEIIAALAPLFLGMAVEDLFTQRALLIASGAGDTK